MTVHHTPDEQQRHAQDEINLVYALARMAYAGHCCATMLELAVWGGFATVDDDPHEARGRARAVLGRARRAGTVVTSPCCESLSTGPRLFVSLSGVTA